MSLSKVHLELFVGDICLLGMPAAAVTDALLRSMALRHSLPRHVIISLTRIKSVLQQSLWKVANPPELIYKFKHMFTP
ncbi:hypothetical protein DFH11DRAFT_1621898 [Phellopilus nigrolimitatus]|nr:hypothetical protein DFH11DRAFT_1621898 [Phellopilus nigrolimitatus]